MEMTLREVCDSVQVSRRAVQGYEKAGLVSASGKNKYGHLIYDVRSQERIQQVKLFQQLGFTLKEIKDLIDAPNAIIKAALEQQAEKLQEKREHQELLISEVHKLIDAL